MPPIQVFAALDTFMSLSEDMPPGLPTRVELNRWIKEHDGIEKETEMFDAGDMRKLKKFTKGTLIKYMLIFMMYLSLSIQPQHRRTCRPKIPIS